MSNLQAILKTLPTIGSQIETLREIILSNVVMIAEIGAATFQEQRRAAFLTERFTELQLTNCSTDECHNAFGILQGSEGGRTILVVAHLDTIFSSERDLTVTVRRGAVQGIGLADNSLGVAIIASLPLILERLQLSFRSNIILMGSARSLGSGNIEGIRFFLDNSSLKVDQALCVEGVELGRLSVGSIGMLRAKLTLTKPEILDWSRFDVTSAIVDMNNIINRIQEIPLPRRPRTTVALNAIHADASFSHVPTSAQLLYEIRSESEVMAEQIATTIEHISDEVASRSEAQVTLQTIARRRPGGMSFSHPMVGAARAILSALEEEPHIQPSTSELSACIDRGIPALTIGISHCNNLNTVKEQLELKPIAKGVAQLIALLQAIDEGLCDETE